jgi:hypothetical protein
MLIITQRHRLTIPFKLYVIVSTNSLNDENFGKAIRCPFRHFHVHTAATASTGTKAELHMPVSRIFFCLATTLATSEYR